MGPLRGDLGERVGVAESDDGKAGRLVVSYGKRHLAARLTPAQLRLLAADCTAVAAKVEGKGDVSQAANGIMRGGLLPG